MGRKTYEQVLGFGDWPMRRRKLMFTGQRASAREKTQNLFLECRGVHTPLKENTDKDIWLVGGSQLIKAFLEEDLVDDMIVFIVPIILGGGIPLFDRIGKEIKLKMTNTERYKSGLLRMEYNLKPT